jgi:hypothetical protein
MLSSSLRNKIANNQNEHGNQVCLWFSTAIASSILIIGSVAHAETFDANANSPKPSDAGLKKAIVEDQVNDQIGSQGLKQNSSVPIAPSIASTESALIHKLNQDLQELKDLSADNKNAQNVTSVSQLTDVRPTDWAFTALQSLVERYGCIAGYPDRTYRGNQATSRYEFASGIN